jgi:hypothetical protein
MHSALQESDQTYQMSTSVFSCTITTLKLPDVRSPTEKKMLGRKNKK